MKYGYRTGYRLVAVAAVIVATAIAAASWRADRPPRAGFAQLPLHFEPSAVDGTYVARGRGYLLELDTDAARLHLSRPGGSASVALNLVGARTAQPKGEGALAGVSNYFVGNDPARWRSRVPHFERVRYAGLYPGIDLVYYGAGRELEYDFVVAPGASPASIRFAYEGASGLRIDDAGNLRVSVDGGELVHRKPVAYQQLANGARKSIRGAFRLASNAAAAVASFDIGKYDTRLPLVIDPVLTYATYLGGTADNEQITTIAVDGAGAVYIAGTTLATDFPATGGAFDESFNGNFDVFVAKLNPQATALEYATYLGGNAFEQADALRIDAAGNAYVAGYTDSANFPVSGSAPQGTHGGNRDVFVAKLNPQGTALQYATYIGGTNSEPANGVVAGFAVDVAGNAYVYGTTESTDLPTTAGAPQTARGNPNSGQFDEDTFLTKVNAAGTAFAFSTYNGGSAIDATNEAVQVEAAQLRLDDNGSAWVIGTTESADFPTTAGAFDTTFGGPAGGNPGGGDAFVTRFDTVASTRAYSTYLGGTGDELGEAIAVDATGNAYVSMRTGSTNFPVTAGAFDTGYNGGNTDVAVAKVNPAGSALVYATYLGGSNVEASAALRVDVAGSVFVAGSTQSTNFPTIAGAADTTHNGGQNDGFIARLNAAGSALLYSTFAGSGDSDGVFLFEIDSAGSAYGTLGDTLGNATVTTGGRSYVGNSDDYFVKVNAAGTAFLDGSYIGGSEDEAALAMALDAQQNLYLGGATTSSDYPTTAGVIQPAKAGSAGAQDAFLVKFATTPDSATPQPGTLAFTSNTFDIAESGATAALTVSRTGGSSGAVSVSCTASTEPGFTAAAGVDFTAANITLNWADGDNANKICSVPIIDDTAQEGDETFLAELSSPSGGASLGTPAGTTVTITDDDSPSLEPGTVQFGAASASVDENGGSVTLTLTRTNGADGAISVSVASGGGSAAAGADYAALSQTVSWSDGDTAPKAVALIVTDDSTDEANETAIVSITNPAGGATLGAPASTTVTIVDNDPPPPGPSTQSVTTRGSYGGGAMGWWMLLPAVLLLFSRRSGFSPTPTCRAKARPTVWMLLLLLPVASWSADDTAGWYVGLRGGIATSTLDASDIESALTARGHVVDATVDDSHAMGALFGGHRWANGLGLEMALVDLGEYDVALSATTTDPDRLLADARSVLADAGRGVSASLTWTWALTGEIELTPRAGAYYWESERELHSSAGSLRSTDSGIEATAGIALGWRLSPAWSLAIGWEAWDAGDRNDVRAWNAALTYRFGSR
jgi:hypothetical protein